MGNDYIDTTIGEQITLQRGFDITKGEQKIGNIPVVSSGGISSFHDEAKVKAPGVVLGRKGSLGTVYYLEQDFWPHDTTLWVKDFKGNNPRFVYYFFKVMSESLKKMDVGAANPSLNRNHIHILPSIWPLRTIQDQIEKLISPLDDKISLNRQINQTLEQMAQTLFKSWFVDFDPVIDNALDAGNEIPELLQTRAELRQKIRASQDFQPLPADVRVLFPAEFEERELGWVPKGWEFKQVQEHCIKVQNGATPSRSVDKYWTNGHIPWLTSGEVRQSIITKVSNFITEDGLNNSSAKWVGANSTLVALYGATAGEVSINAYELTTNQAVCALIPKDNYQWFNYLAISEKVTEFQGKAVGSAQQNISKGIVESTIVISPNINVVKYFNESSKSYFNKVIANQVASDSLSRLRDTLLPKLISGELRLDEIPSP